MQHYWQLGSRSCYRFFSSEKLTIEECNIIDNHGVNTFHKDAIGQIEVINCFLRNVQYSEGVTIKNTYNEEIKNELKHLSEEECRTKQSLPILADPFSESINLRSIMALRQRRR